MDSEESLQLQFEAFVFQIRNAINKQLIFSLKIQKNKTKPSHKLVKKNKISKVREENNKIETKINK